MKTQVSKAREELHRSFIVSRWINLAIAAYDGYVKLGRGMVIIREVDFIGKSLSDVRNFSITYRGHNDLLGQNAWIGDEESEIIQSYDPAKMVILGVVQENSGITCYFYLGQNMGLPVILWHANNGTSPDEIEKGELHGCLS